MKPDRFRVVLSLVARTVDNRQETVPKLLGASLLTALIHGLRHLGVFHVEQQLLADPFTVLPGRLAGKQEPEVQR